MTTEINTQAPADIEGIVRLGEGSRLPDPAAQLGGKGLRLDALAARGFPVPPGFCLTSGLLEGGKLSEAAAEALVQAYRELGSPTVAVRSSAANEDQGAASAAGVYETVLGVRNETELVEAARTCLESATSERSRSYHGDAAEVGMAVVVQHLVDANASGVLFTVDPVTGDRRHLVAEACWGAGEGLVQGRVHTDEFRLDAETGAVADRTVRNKSQKVVVSPGSGPEVVDVPKSKQDKPCLNKSQLAELGRIARTIRDEEQGDVDIEFCCTADTVWVLQSRPVTAVGGRQEESLSPYQSRVPDAVRDGTMWSRMDIGEIFNGIMTPMGLSFSRYYQENVHIDCVRSTGISELGHSDVHMGYLGGYVYLNISYTAHMLQQAPPQRDQSLFTERFRSEQTAEQPYENPFGQFPSGMPLWRGSAYWVASTLREMATMHARARSLTASRHREYERAHSEDLAALSRAELGDRLRHALDYFHRTHVGYMPYYFNAIGFYRILDNLCASWLNGASAAEVVDGVKSNMSALRTVRTAGDLAELARVAAGLPEVKNVLTTLPGSEARAALETTAEGKAFLEQHVEPFMREHGTRGSQEMELSHPRWVDDWTYVMSMLSNYLSQPGLLDTVERHVQNRMEPDDVLSSLSRPRATLLRQVIKGYATFSRLREVTRMPMVTAIWMVRRVVVEAARRAVESGLIASQDDVWYLDFDRLRQYLAGELSQEEFFSAKDLAAGRELHEARLRAPEPPLTIIGTWDGRDQSKRRDRTADVLEGFGTSAGRATGTARVVTDMHAQSGEFQAGEILVTTFTDASWTPLFAMAAGVVTDTGSMLSHSSIVARELKIPSVVNTHDGTTAIATGDVVRIDGTTGVVEILERRSGAAE